MRNLKLVVEYDGTDFHGFQRQRQLRTVQGVLEERFSALLGEKIKITGAGRTDAGVHASGQVVNFRTTRPIEMKQIVKALNAALPRDIKVQRCEEVKETFHARRSASSRTYRYTLIERPAPSPLLGRFALIVPERLNLTAMQRAVEPLIGRHNFRAFQASGSETMTTERTLMRLDCQREGTRIEITAEADSFLYQMVRIIVGAMLQVGRRQMPPSAPADALRNGERLPRCTPAPACGLSLVEVSYQRETSQPAHRGLTHQGRCTES